MKILQYNILNGCRSPERFEKLDRWIAKQSYDLIGFNEMNGWTGPSLADQAAKWGYAYSEVFVTTVSKHFVGVISKRPFRIIESIEKPFHHGLLHILVDGVHFLITHLSPKSSEAREMEAEFIAEMVRKIDEPLLLMGDLNTLSPLDTEHYEREQTLQALYQDDALLKKFVTDGQINYRPMQILLDAGLIDTDSAKPLQHSVPTTINVDKMHAAKLRLDYMLVNKKLSELHPTARILHNDEVDQLSDHYPIECKWG